MKRAVTPPRFRSRVFSTPQRFLGNPELCGLVSCRYRSWDPPFRAFPSSRSLTPLGAAWLPCSYPPACRNACLDALSPLVSPTTATSASAWIPQRLWAPFPRTEVRLLVTLGVEPRNRLVPPASPTSKRLSLFESVRRRSESPHQDGPLLSWVSAPLESSPSKPRSLVPARARGLKHARSP
jgi:hypothetical protein